MTLQKNRKSKLSFALLIAAASGFLFANNASARNYDGYCYQKNNNVRTKGTIIGAVSGAVIGSNVASRGNRTEGSILGAVVGGVIGSQIGQSVKETNRASCMNNVYYPYNNGYYAPSTPPNGYRVAYFYDRPSGVTYYNPQKAHRNEQRRRHRENNRDYNRNYNSYRN